MRHWEQKRIAAASAACRTPVFREKMRRIAKARSSNAEWRSKLSAAAKRRWQSSDYRAKMALVNHSGAGTKAWSRMSRATRKARAAKISRTIRGSYRSGERKVTGGHRSTKGWIRTPWGRFRFDSSWERHWILIFMRDRRVAYVQRNYPVRYKDGVWRTFFADFLIRFANGRRLLVEVKNPYLVSLSRKKLQAARRHCRRKGYDWLLLTGLDDQGYQPGGKGKK